MRMRPRRCPRPCRRATRELRFSCGGTHGCKKVQSKETCTELLLQVPATCSRGSRKSPNHHIGSLWNDVHQVDADMTKPACDSMSNHRRPDSLTHNQSESRTAATH